jgi:hypothetical protein
MVSTMKPQGQLSDRVRVTPATEAERPLLEGLF